MDDETCLFVSLNVEDGVTYKAARRTCSGDGGKVAVIPDNKAYDLVMAYVRSILDKQDMDSIELWTGLKIDPLVRKDTYIALQYYLTFNYNLSSVGSPQ